MSGTGIDFYNRTYGQARRKVRSVAASATLGLADNGSLIVVTNTATITLPAVAQASGIEYLIFNAADTNLTITAPTATLVVFNNAAATSIAFSTSAEKIGSGVRVICDGALWYCFVNLGAESVTPTIS
jgi:hypothetical protein